MSKLFFLIAFLPTISIAQKTEDLFDIWFKPTKVAPRYYVITEKKGDLWYREAYYLPERSMAMQGTYKDEACKIPVGELTWFHANKNLSSRTNYVNGKKEGMALSFHENGMMNDSSVYKEDRLIGVSFGWDAEGNLEDSSNFDGAGNGTEIHCYPGGRVRSIGYFTRDTVKIKRWKYFHANGNIWATEDYENGKRINCSCFDEQGQKLDSTFCIEREANFPGEERGWRRFLEKTLNPVVPAKNGAPDGAFTIWVQFIVDTAGHITNIKPLTQYGYGMEEEVVRILKRSPDWIPALQFGRKVKAYRKQPITFVVSKE